MPEEKSLVYRAQQRDEAALARLYEDNFDKIYRYVALKLGDKTEAEDITQQVFLKALRSIASFRWKDVPFSAWLFRIARNAVIDHVRRRKPEVSLDSVTAELPADNAALVDQVVETEMWQTLRSLIADLPDEQADLLVLKLVGGLSAAEIGETLGKSAGAVRVELHRIVKKLRARYMEHEGEKIE